MGYVEPSKTIPPDTFIRNAYEDKITEVPKGCYYQIDSGYDGGYEISLYSLEEIPNPNYESDLAAYNQRIKWAELEKKEKAKKSREQKKAREANERAEYERLKKKFGEDT